MLRHSLRLCRLGRVTSPNIFKSSESPLLFKHLLAHPASCSSLVNQGKLVVTSTRCLCSNTTTSIQKRRPTPTEKGETSSVVTETEASVQHVAFETPEKLFESIRKTGRGDVETLLQLVHLHKDQMFDNHVLECLHKLFVYVKGQQADETLLHPGIVQDRRFHELCVALINWGPQFSPSQIVSTVYKLKEFELGSRSVPMQVFLELGKHVINDLKFVDIIHFADSVWDMEPTNQVAILKEALSALALSKFDYVENLQQVDALVKYVSCFGERLTQRQAASLMFVLEDSLDDMSYHYALRLLSCMHKLIIQTAPVVNYCLSKVETRAAKQGLRKTDILKVLRAYGNLNIRDPELLKVMLASIVSEYDRYSVKELLEICDSLVYASFYSQEVFDLLFDRLTNGETSIGAMELSDIRQILHNLSFVNYRHEALNELLDPLVDTIEKNADHLSWYEQVCSLLDMAVMGKYPSELLQKVLKEEVLGQLGNGDESHDWLLLRELARQRSTISNSLEPLNSFPRNMMTVWKFSRLQKCIVKNLDSLDQLVINAYSPEGLHLEYLLGLDEDTSTYVPLHTSKCTQLKDMPNDNEPVLLESLNVPEHLQKVVIMSVSRDGVVQNTGQLSGRNRLHVETLQTLGYLTIPINRARLLSLSEKERLKYIKQRLRKPHNYQDLQWFGVGSF